MVMTEIQTAIKDAATEAIASTLAEEIQDIVAKETRRAFREHEDQITVIVREAVASALAEAFR
jgi:hypothetical protein